MPKPFDIKDTLRHQWLRYQHLTVLGWLVVFGLTTHSDSVSVYIGPSPKERKWRETTDESKNVQTTPPTATASAVGPCPTVIQIVGRPDTGRPAQSHHPTTPLTVLTHLQIDIQKAQPDLYYHRHNNLAVHSNPL